MSEVAACRAAVGIAVSMDIGVLELRGSRNDLTAFAVAQVGHAPAVAQPVEAFWGWWMTVSGQRALAVRDPAGVRSLPALDAMPDDLAVSDRSAELGALLLVGPRAGLLASDVATGADWSLVSLGTDEDYRVLLVDRGKASTTFQRALRAGRTLGVVSVGLSAIRTQQAAARVLSGQRVTPDHSLQTNQLGAPAST
jgi:hypothetical protein